MEQQSSSHWTLLSNHGAALVHLVSEPDATIIEIADAVGVRERAAAQFVSDLRRQGYLVATRVGRRNTYEVDLQRTLPDPILAHRTVADLLDHLVDPSDVRAVNHRRGGKSRVAAARDSEPTPFDPGPLAVL